MNIVIVILGGFLSFLISMIVLVKREENKENTIIKQGERKVGLLKNVALKKKTATKNAMRISYLATYEYKILNQTYTVKTIFEISMDDVNSIIPNTVPIAYEMNHPKNGYVVYESNDRVHQQSTSKGMYIAVLLGVIVGLILYHFLVQRII